MEETSHSKKQDHACLPARKVYSRKGFGFVEGSHSKAICFRGKRLVTNKLELLLRKAGRDLADYQIARFWKFPEEMMRTPCDFMGFTRHGRAILIEAKQVDRTALPIHASPGLLPHQFTALNEANEAGAISLVCWARKNVCATISFDMVLEFSKDRESVPWASIDKRFHRRMDGDLAHLMLLDHWLPVEPFHCSS